MHSTVQLVKKTNFEIINLCQKQQYMAFLPENLDNRCHFELQVTMALKRISQGLAKHHKIPLHIIVGKTNLTKSLDRMLGYIILLTLNVPIPDKVKKLG